MGQRLVTRKSTAEGVIRDIRRKTRKRCKRTVRDIRLTTVDNFNYQLCISNYVRGKKK